MSAAKFSYSYPRAYKCDGDVFLIRDVVNADGKFAGRCQYGVLSGDTIEWRDCVEGVEFSAIAPLVTGALDASA